jgi:hypothetical protein
VYLCWEHSGKEVVVEFSESLISTNWQQVVSPTVETNATIHINGNTPRGFYRIRTVD